MRALRSQWIWGKNDDKKYAQWWVYYIQSIHINLVTGLFISIESWTKWQLFSLKMIIFSNLTILLEQVNLLSLEHQLFLSHLEIKRGKKQRFNWNEKIDVDRQSVCSKPIIVWFGGKLFWVNFCGRFLGRSEASFKQFVGRLFWQFLEPFLELF